MARRQSVVPVTPTLSLRGTTLGLWATSRWFRWTCPDAPLSYVGEEIRRALETIDHIRY